VYHVLNRAVARLALFEKEADYAAFERVLAEAMERHPTRLLSYVVMPNRWHLDKKKSCVPFSSLRPLFFSGLSRSWQNSRT
jgi:hypothetical protein